jgi:hypothetical protein
MTQYMNESTLVRRQPSGKLSFAKTALLATSFLSGAMLGLAMPNLVSGSGTMIAIKSALLAAAGMTVAYAVNRLAVERGAPLAIKGYGWAGIVSALSILIVGGGLFSATYAGLVYDDVEQLSIDAHGEALSGFVSDSTAAAAQASGIVPAINTVVSDLTQKRDCEIAESCISGHIASGNGPVARILTEKLGKASALALAVERGETQKAQAIETINALYEEYQATASGDLSMDEKRRALHGIDLKIKQATADLDEAYPVALLGAYAEELKAGVEVGGKPDVARTLSDILRQHGQTISELVRTLPEDAKAAPAFPKATGVSDTFSYIGHFLPIAAITAVVELVFPISLWLYTLFALSWSAHRMAPPQPRPLDPEDEFFQRLLPGPDHSQGKDDGSSITPRQAGRGGRPRRANGHDDQPGSKH